MIEEQSKKVEQRIDALLLVGGFAGSEYLTRRVEVRSHKYCVRNELIVHTHSCDQAQFSGRIKVIARPSDADTATVRGAAHYGLARKSIVSTVIAPRSYIMKVSVAT
jgi:hypothetical protein